MKRVRSFKSNSENLDVKLVALQDEGYGITQILPCPETMQVGATHPKSDAFDANIKMNFIIIYIEEKESV